MRLWIKIILYFFIAIILLVAGMVLFTQTQIFKNWIKDKIVNEANKNLNANLSIGKIHGNLLTHFQISDVLLMNDQTKSIDFRLKQSTLPDTILSLSELTIDFSPARLLKKEIYIKLIELDSIHFRLLQLPDSSWNFEHLLISKPDTGVKPPEPTHPMKWQVDLNDMLLKNGRIDLFPLNESPIIPHRIDNINTQASLTYDRNGLQADLDNLRLKSQQPDFVLKKLSFNLSLEKNKLNIRQLLLQ
jgi:uncharacterized protein involved in outer membrane biogenesis